MRLLFAVLLIISSFTSCQCSEYSEQTCSRACQKEYSTNDFESSFFGVCYCRNKIHMSYSKSIIESPDAGN